VPESDDGMKSNVVSLSSRSCAKKKEAASIVDRNCETLISGAGLCNQHVIGRENKYIIETHNLNTQLLD
jgi:hypothetical protein